jgi:hypothetical protein
LNPISFHGGHSIQCSTGSEQFLVGFNSESEQFLVGFNSEGCYVQNSLVRLIAFSNTWHVSSDRYACYCSFTVYFVALENYIQLANYNSFLSDGGGNYLGFEDVLYNQ